MAARRSFGCGTFLARQCRILWSLCIFLCAVILLSGCQPIAAPQGENSANAEANSSVEATTEVAPLTPVSIGVGYIPSVQFATYYVAMDQGYFADEGIDATLEYGFENDYLKLVGVGERQFMIGSGDQVILGRAQELPVRYVMNWYTRYPVVLFAKEKAGITKPEDLAGKRIGIPGPYGATYVAYRGLLEAAGLTEADVKTESIGFTQAAAVSEETVDAAVDYAVSGPVVLQEAGEQIVTLGLDEYLSIPSNGLVTNETTLADEPELVRAMIRASLKGIEYTLAHPDEAFAIALKYVPEAGAENEQINRAIFDATLEYWRPVQEGVAGATDAQTWQTAAEFMESIGMVESAPPAEELFTNDYLP